MIIIVRIVSAMIMIVITYFWRYYTQIVWLNEMRRPQNCLTEGESSWIIPNRIEGCICVCICIYIYTLYICTAYLHIHVFIFTNASSIIINMHWDPLQMMFGWISTASNLVNDSFVQTPSVCLGHDMSQFHFQLHNQILTL